MFLRRYIALSHGQADSCGEPDTSLAACEVICAMSNARVVWSRNVVVAAVICRALRVRVRSSSLGSRYLMMEKSFETYHSQTDRIDCDHHHHHHFTPLPSLTHPPTHQLHPPIPSALSLPKQLQPQSLRLLQQHQRPSNHTLQTRRPLLRRQHNHKHTLSFQIGRNHNAHRRSI